METMLCIFVQPKHRLSAIEAENASEVAALRLSTQSAS